MSDIPLPDYQKTIIDLTKADNGPKSVTKALIRKDHQALEQIVTQHLANRAVALCALNALTDEEKQAKHKSGFPQGSYLFLRKICFLSLAAQASLCLASFENYSAWRSIDALVAREEGKITMEVIIECVWGLLFRCHMDRTFYNGMQRAGKQNEVSDRMVRTIYLGIYNRLFHFPFAKAGKE